MPTDLQTLASTAYDGAELLALARLTPAELEEALAIAEPGSTLADVMRRLFDPQEREHLTVSAFSSAL